MINGLGQDEITAIKDKRWQLDFSQMKLVRNDSSHSLEGPGYIGMEPDGGMTFKLYPNEQVDVAQGAKWFTERFVKLIPIEKCYTLTATDAHGRDWEAVQILPNVQTLSESNTTVSGNIYGQLKGSSRVQDRLANGKVSFICFEKYDCPFNSGTGKYHDEDGKPVKIGWSLDTAKFSASELDFFLTDREEKFVICITSKTPSIPSIVETRAIEALQFLLGRAIDWRILEKHENGNECIKVRLIHAATGTIHPPLRYRGPREADYWNLYVKYFEYICRNQNDDIWHPISIFIHRILEARKASIETQCLALSVVVEGLLRTEFGDLAKPPDDLFNWIEQAKNVLNQSKIPTQIVGRIAEVIDGMKTPRASDQFQELVRQSVITKKEKDTWTKLRNSSTHPECAFFENFEFEKAVDAFDTVLTLFYKLIFHRIGYCGKYTDYGTPDMTDAVFPPKA
jgi:hypothetical protein